MNKISINDICNILKNDIKNEIDHDEFTYLGLTSKIENPLRDLLAKILHRRYQDQYIIAREWRRCDLAILDKDDPKKPVMLIEFKACYSCCLLKESTLDEYETGIKKDFEKSNEISKKANKYSILLVTKPKQKIDIRYKKVVKYLEDINAPFNKDRIPKEFEEKGYKNIKDRLENYKSLSGSILKGSAFGVETEFGFLVFKEK